MAGTSPTHPPTPPGAMDAFGADAARVNWMKSRAMKSEDVWLRQHYEVMAMPYSTSTTPRSFSASGNPLSPPREYGYPAFSSTQALSHSATASYIGTNPVEQYWRTVEMNRAQAQNQHLAGMAYQQSIAAYQQSIVMRENSYAGMAAATNNITPLVQVPAPVATVDLTTVDNLTSAIVDGYGAAEMEKSAALSDKLLAFVGAEAGTEFSDKLGNLILVAKGLDPQEAEKRRTWWRKLLNFFGVQAETAASQFKMVDAQITTLATELARHSDRQRSRHGDLEKLFDENRAAYDEIQKLVKTGRVWLSGHQASQVGEVVTGMEAQDLADAQALARRLDKRLVDLDVALTLMLQTAPEIRIMQANANALVDKFTTLTKLTIPALKKQFALHVLQVEQKSSAVIADAVDDTTNDAFKKNADALHNNTVQVAKSGQRQIMEIGTVEYVQKQLLKTIDDVRQVNNEAATARLGVAQKLQEIRHDLVKSTAGTYLPAPPLTAPLTLMQISETGGTGGAGVYAINSKQENKHD